MSNVLNREVGRNVFATDPRPNFHSNRQLVDLLSKKGCVTNSSTALSVSTAKGKQQKHTATYNQSPECQSKLKRQFPKSQSLKKLVSSDNVPETYTFKTRKQSIQKPLQTAFKHRNSNQHRTEGGCCPSTGCPHGTFCHNFAQNINQYFKYQEITTLIKTLKTRTKSDVYAFHKVFDVLMRHCYHNKQLINDLRAI